MNTIDEAIDWYNEHRSFGHASAWKLNTGERMYTVVAKEDMITGCDANDECWGPMTLHQFKKWVGVEDQENVDE